MFVCGTPAFCAPLLSRHLATALLQVELHKWRKWRFKSGALTVVRVLSLRASCSTQTAPRQRRRAARLVYFAAFT